MPDIKKIETKYGPILMKVGTKYCTQFSRLEFEKDFIKIIETEDYDFFVDIGAGWGYHTIPAGFNTDIVYSFEPSRERYKILKRNIKNLNLDEKVILSSKAVGTGKMKLFSGWSMLGPKHKHRQIPEKKIEWVSLENVVKPHLDKNERGIIKIDVEGNEPDVIESAGDLNLYKGFIWLIERHHIPEEDYGYSEDRLIDIMEPFDYELVGKWRWTAHYVFKWRGK